MGLKDGSLRSLVEADANSVPQTVAQTLLHHMLLALEYLDAHNIIHRDVKPENILWILRSNQPHFQLGDFGLSNHQLIAATFTGSPLYMAPELFQNQLEQTPKADIWALYVTMLWTLDTAGFRGASEHFKSAFNARQPILSVAASEDSVSKLRKMASANPNERASAAQMLADYFGTPKSTTLTFSATEPGGNPPVTAQTETQSSVPDPVAPKTSGGCPSFAMESVTETSRTPFFT